MKKLRTRRENMSESGKTKTVRKEKGEDWNKS